MLREDREVGLAGVAVAALAGVGDRDEHAAAVGLAQGPLDQPALLQPAR